MLVGSLNGQDVDEIDSAFSDILARVETLSRSILPDFSPGSDLFGPSTNNFRGGRGSSPFSFLQGDNSNNNALLPRLRVLFRKVTSLIGELYRTGLGDEAVAIKQNIVELASSMPMFAESIFLPRKAKGPDSDKKLEKRVDDLDSLVNRFEKVTSEFRSLPVEEKSKVVEKNQKALETLNAQHIKVAKRCYYLRNRIEYLVNELNSSGNNRSNKALIDRLLIWKKFIENNEYVLNQRLTREERGTLYSFLNKKLVEVEPDLRETEDFVFGF